MSKIKEHNKTYRGVVGGDVFLNGKTLSMRLNIRNHSPTGLAWGYGGSGPAQLALAILCEEYGEDVDKHPVYYQDFKWAVIAKLDFHKAWSLTSDQIRESVQRLKHDLEKQRKAK